jgi:RNA polymerase sigma-70 factor (ECF subfamily)
MEAEAGEADASGYDSGCAAGTSGACCAGLSQLCSTCEALLRRLSAMRPRLARRLRSRGLDKANAEELSCEVLILAWQKLDEVPTDAGEAERWLHGVGRNLWRNHLRIASRRVRLAGEIRSQALVDDRLHIALSSGVERRVLVTEAWQQLHPSDREILQVVAVEGVDLEDLARRLGCRPSAAATRLWRARSKLRVLMES